MTFRILSLLLLACALPASAQTVRGRVTDRATQQPVVGAFVVLLDATGDGVRADISGPGGEFQHRAPGPGVYRLRVERIGVQTVTSPAFEIGEGATVAYDLPVETRAVTLPVITATAGARCTVRPSGGVPLEQVWDEARKALSLAAWTQEQGGVPFTTMTWERTRSLGSLAVHEEVRRMRSGFDRATFFSASARELADGGYVRAESDGSYTYYGVDAANLLSDDFLDTHCFRLRAGPREQPELLGLEFEPVRGQSRPDIRGVLWLDRQSSQLRHLEFHYTRHLRPRPVPLEHFGGRVEFTRLENGAWIVERWWIRMPQVDHMAPWVVRVGGRAIRTEDLRTLRGRDLADAAMLLGLTVREAGGDVVLVHDVNRVDAAGTGTASLEGVVVDSVGGTPLAGATVYVAGTHHVARTDAAGRFQLRGLPAGEQRVSFFHPRTDSLLLVIPLREVALAPGATATVTLGVPRTGQCIGTAGVRRAALVGHVRSAEPDSAVADAAVEATIVLDAAREAYAWLLPLATYSDSAGRYLLCGLPVGIDLAINAAAPFLNPAAIRRTLPSEGLYHHDFT
ncbi:MAG TPA: carboxypeptidase regulatory-like domain-containing protein, partial [Longimicrobium sp.]|nr:carboxypeptidase regulatory-like domain-containing protein [Longimicrobium sp.]